MKKDSGSKKMFWLRLAAPLLIVAAWLTVAGVGGPYFGKISEVSSNDLSTFLPTSAESTKVKDQLDKFYDTSTTPLLVVFESDKKFNDDSKSAVTSIREKLENEKAVKGEVSPAVYSEDEKAAFLVAPLESDIDYGESIDGIKSVLADEKTSLKYQLTGPAMFARDLEGAFAGIDGTLLIVTLVTVFIILLLIYRSLILPLVTLTGAMAALAAAVLSVWHLADAGAVQINGQVQGILFILVIGAATDYSLLYIARYREELQRHKTAWEATKASWKASFEPILAAGATVSLGLLCLLASDLGSNRALGPVGGMGIAFAVLIALTFLPAALLLIGRVVFWPRIPKYVAKKSVESQSKKAGFWKRVARLVESRPRQLWMGIGALMLLACLAVPTLKAEGVSQQSLIMGESEARNGQEMLDRHFPGGSGLPTYVLVSEENKDKAIDILDKEKGVEGVGITSDEAALPVGKSAEEMKSDIKEKVINERAEQLADLKSSLENQMTGAPAEMVDQVYNQAANQVPSVDKLTEQAADFLNQDPTVVDGNVLLQATLTDGASSGEARETVQKLREDLSSLGAKIGGVSAIQLDTNTASERDLKVIIPMILLSITIVLMMLLRSIVAPLLLMITTVASFGATMGIAALMFNHVWQFPGADPAVIIFGFVFLVALGIDYNIFLMTRAREETLKLGAKKGMLKALIVTGGVITSAGIVLAATFAALYVIPILFLAQIAFIVAFGVLLDALIVRSLFVPALTLELGEKMWWPSKISRRKKS